MPSFDVISEVDKHELTNAVDQANRELTNRFDFKGVDAKYVLEENTIQQSAPSEFQLQQMLDILRSRLTTYDATYVTLAAQLDCPLVTCDRRLARSVRADSVEVF